MRSTPSTSVEAPVFVILSKMVQKAGVPHLVARRVCLRESRESRRLYDRELRGRGLVFPAPAFLSFAT